MIPPFNVMTTGELKLILPPACRDSKLDALVSVVTETPTFTFPESAFIVSVLAEKLMELIGELRLILPFVAVTSADVFVKFQDPAVPETFTPLNLKVPLD